MHSTAARLAAHGAACLALGLLAPPAAAQAPGAQAPPLLADEIVVTAGRIEQRLEDAAADVTVLTRPDIERSAAQTADDLLRQIPGFSLFRRASSLAAHPTAQGVSLRGIGASGASRTLVLLDGVPLNDPFGGWVYWSRVPPESLERVEVVRGGTASVWGNYAMGGVINLITARPARRTVAFAGEGGTRGTANLHLSGSDRWGALGASLAGHYFRTGGYPIVRRDQRGPIDVDADSAHGAFDGRLEYDLSPAATLFVHGNFFAETRGNGTRLSHNETETGSVGAGTAVTLPDGSDWRLSVFAQLQTFESTFSTQAPDRNSESPALDQFDVPSASVGTSLQWSKPVHEAHLLAAGTDFRWVDGETNEDFRFVAGRFTGRRRAGAEQQFVGAFVEDFFTPGPRWLISAAGRLDLWRSLKGERVERSLDSGAVSAARRFPDRERVIFSSALSVRYEATDRVAARGAFYRGFRAPTINELFRPFRVRNDITEANAGLDPERLLGGEAGLDYRTGTFLGRLTGYWNDVEDPIANVTVGSGPGEVAPCGTVPEGGLCRQRRNLGRARIRGVEVGLERAVGRSWTAGAAYLFSRSEIVGAAGQPALQGKRLPQVPEHQLVVKVGYAASALVDAAVQVRYLGDQFEDDLNSLALGDFAVVDVSLARRIEERVELFFRVENLFDRAYEVGKSGDGLVTIGAPLLAHGGVRLRF